MKQIYALLLFITSISFAQQPYYDGFDFSQTGDVLKSNLGQLIDNDASTTYTYGDVRDDFLIMELDPNDNTDSNVLLTYGYVNTLSCTSGQTDRRIRDKNDFGGNTCEYNREHVFARSNADPTMGDVSNGDTGIAADPHNLRATDVQRNGERGSRKFGEDTNDPSASGVLGNGDYYPGNEWKGDIARIMMYMYTRYGDRCLPELNANGAKQGTTDMLQILLEWNAEDPVSPIEDARNNQLEIVYENRNPFIDNPYLATVIWGGPAAEDRWGTLSSTSNELNQFNIYPNPTQSDVTVQLKSPQRTTIEVYDILGKKVLQKVIYNSGKIETSRLKSGVYILKIRQGTSEVNKRLVKR
ncbi:endonuclease [Winogradskyella sp. A3E31]|uniref:endonuclease n=1 Tax=Winogradskyella sp. A3E31 TaxID=3349637 RepID=UPI00398A7033